MSLTSTHLLQFWSLLPLSFLLLPFSYQDFFSFPLLQSRLPHINSELQICPPECYSKHLSSCGPFLIQCKIQFTQTIFFPHQRGKDDLYHLFAVWTWGNSWVGLQILFYAYLTQQNRRKKPPSCLPRSPRSPSHCQSVPENFAISEVVGMNQLCLPCFVKGLPKS